MFTSGVFAALALVASASAAAVTDPTVEANFVQKLRDSPTAVDQVNNVLSSDSDFVFDFFDPKAPATVGAGGRIVTASAGNFPAVVGHGSAMAVGFLEPCSMNTPHTHPRATEIQISMNSTIRTGMITENGARFVMTELPPGSMTIFPVGSVHFQVNDGCDPALFVAGFNSEDPGVLSIAQRFFGLPPDIISAALGDLGVEEVLGLEALIPDNVAIGTEACLQRCGLKLPTQSHAQLQPTVSGNAAPSGVVAASWSVDTQTTYAKTTYAQTTYAQATYTQTTAASKSTQTYTPYSKPVNHWITVGADGLLLFEPQNITANVGDTVTFEFHQKNHSVTQSSFSSPCHALAETTGQIGFESGFMFVPPNATTFPTFTITINDTAPTWGYCGQRGPPVHCVAGPMVFSINADESSPNNFAAFQALAKKSGPLTASAAAASGGYGYGKLENNEALSSSSGSSDGKSNISPALIALVVLNGVLFLGLITIGILYIRKHRAAARIARHRQLYTSIGATGEAIFVATEKPDGSARRGHPRSLRAGASPESEDEEARHGLTHGPYYDPHEPQGYHDSEQIPTR
ncbi:RmlC-like cupin [Mycena chlorophos]|uniref:RmlC-like cupin n=1 Tax=Mycena chlorophos TaxID=658473 RepID=A0A8H6TGS8_MYCCL|nr:RmlC-like cupin [Mycena chlorophos]